MICATAGHLWRIDGAGTRRNVVCARCYRCLGVAELLAAYVKVHGDEVVP